MIPLTVKPLWMLTAPVKSVLPEKEVFPVKEVGLLKMASMLKVTLSVPLSVVAPSTLLPVWEGVEETGGETSTVFCDLLCDGGLIWLKEVKEDEAKKDNIRLTMPINRICICCIHTNIYTHPKSRVISGWWWVDSGWWKRDWRLACPELVEGRLEIGMPWTWGSKVVQLVMCHSDPPRFLGGEESSEPKGERKNTSLRS